MRAFPSRNGAVAQLGERLNGIQEVSGSIPLGSTTKLLICGALSGPDEEVITLGVKPPSAECW